MPNRILMGIIVALSSSFLHASEQARAQSAESMPRVSADERALRACVSAFADKLQLAQGVHVRGVMNGQSGELFGSISGSPLAPYRTMQIDLSARRRDDGRVLATGWCNVARNAHILGFTTRIRDAEALAALKQGNLQLALAVRRGL